MPLILGANSLTGGYEVDNSLRFNSGSSDYLSRSASSGSTQTATYSVWIKKSTNATTNRIFSGFIDSSNFTNILFRSVNDEVTIAHQDGGAIKIDLKTSMRFRDNSAWYHIVIVFDLSNGTSSDRVKIYANGNRLTNFDTATYPSISDTIDINNSSATNYIGFTEGTYFSGYMSEIYLIDGQALDPTSFGEFDSDTGIWKPIAYTGTYGTNGFYLEFKDSSALGDDTSGNSNDFTVNNLTSIDQTTDTPTNNFCTANPIFANNEANISSASFSNGNTTYTTTVDSWTFGRGTFGISVGKWYMEAKVTKNGTGEAGNFAIVPDNATDTNGTSIGLRVNSASNEVIEINAGVNTTTFTNFSTGDIVKLAVDLDNGKLWIGKNDTWWNNNNSSATLDVSNPDITGINTAITYLISLGNYRDGGNNNTWDLNFGNPPFTISSGNSDSAGFGQFEYSVPSGYFALCTANLAEYG